MRVTHELQRDVSLRLTLEAMHLINTYGSHFIQFQRFSYIRVGGFDGYPLKLPRYAKDRFVLIDIYRQLDEVNKRCKERKKVGI